MASVQHLREGVTNHGVVQHRTQHAVVRHAFSQVLHARYSRSHIGWNFRRGDRRLMEGNGK